MKSHSKSKRLDLPLLMISSTASSYVRVILFYIHTVWAYIFIYSNCSNRRHHRYRSHHWSDTFPRRYEWNVSTSVRMRQLHSHWWLYRHLIFNVPLSKLYTNSLMSSLNARGGWKLSSQSRDANSTAGVHTTKSMVKLSQSGGRNARPEVDIFSLTVFLALASFSISSTGVRPRRVTRNGRQRESQPNVPGIRIGSRFQFTRSKNRLSSLPRLKSTSTIVFFLAVFFSCLVSEQILGTWM